MHIENINSMKSLRTLTMTAMAAVAMSLTACAQNKPKTMEINEKGKTLVAYFSATGTTKRAAEKIATQKGATLYEITPAQAYTSADLDWNDSQSRSSLEMNDPKSRPALGGEAIEMAEYDTIYIGYPIWWNQAPRPVYTFIDQHDLKGKVLVPFATSGGSSINGSVKHLKDTYPQLNWQKGQLMK